MKTTGRTILLGIIALFCLGGCAHSLVYNEARDKQAQEAKRAAGELKMAEKVRLLEARYDEVAALEVESSRSLAETLRNKELARVARSTTLRESPERPQNGLVNVLETRMQRLGAKTRATNEPGMATRNCGKLDCKSLLSIQTTRAEAKEIQDTFDLSRAEFRSIFGYDFRNCADVAAAVKSRDAFVKRLPDAQRAGVKPDGYLDALRDTCADLAKKEAAFDASLAEGQGELRKVLDEAKRADIQIAEYREKLVEAEAKLATALDDFAKAEKNAIPAQRNSLGSLEARASDLKAIIATVIIVSDTFSVPGAHATTKEVVNQLTVVLGALAGQKPDADKLEPDQQAAVAFVRALPELADEANKLLREAGRARIVPFAVAREHYRLALKGYENSLAIKARRAAALRARADAMTRELAALARAHRLLTEGRQQWETQPLATLNALQDLKERRAFYEALAIYWDEVFLYRSDEQIWKARAQALQFDANLAVSEAAALQWDNLIGGVATVLADYHASGVKPAEIAEFLKAFGLIYIGARVGP